MELNSDELVNALKADLRRKIRQDDELLQTEQQRLAEIKVVADGIRRLDSLADKFERGLELLTTYQQIDDVVRDLTTELPRQLDRLEKLIFIILAQPAGGKLKKIKTSELESNIIQDHVKSLKNQIAQYQKELNRSQQQKAQYGIAVPTHILNEIEAAKKELKKLYVELSFFEEIRND